MPYLEAADGIHTLLNGLHTRKRSIAPYSASLLESLNGQLDPDQIHAAIQEEKPQVIIAIGTRALQMVQNITSLPIVYVMTPNPKSVVADFSNITGINLQIAPVEVMKAIATVFPKKKNLGIVYNPSSNSALVYRAAVSERLFNVVGIPVHSAKEVPAALFKAKGKIDILWMVPDRTIIQPDIVETFVHFSFDNQVPFIAFARKYLKQGATMSISANPFAMGEEAAALAVEILQGRAVADLPPRYTQKIDVEYNLKVMEKIKHKALSEDGTP